MKIESFHFWQTKWKSISHFYWFSIIHGMTAGHVQITAGTIWFRPSHHSSIASFPHILPPLEYLPHIIWYIPISFITYFSLYVFIAQIFNFFEPFRNRPGTGIFGFDEQTNFWIYGSHRLIGSFREPIFLVSILFPVFVILHFKTNITKLNYALFAILFGLTKIST